MFWTTGVQSSSLNRSSANPGRNRPVGNAAFSIHRGDVIAGGAFALYTNVFFLKRGAVKRLTSVVIRDGWARVRRAKDRPRKPTDERRRISRRANSEVINDPALSEHLPLAVRTGFGRGEGAISLPVEAALVRDGDALPPSVSIVIPAFNESRRIADSLCKVREFLRRTPLSFEILVVNDGSTDGTAEIVRGFEPEGVRLIDHAQHRGKGYSVRTGVLKAIGTYVLFTDADLSTPIDELERLYDIAERGPADIVIGSRAIDRRWIERHQSRVREIGGVMFNRMVRIGMGLNLYDTQCGFKLFHRARTRPIFEKQTIDGFGFDPEILFLAAQRRLRIREVPVRWSHADDTKVRVMRDGLRMMGDLLRIRLNDLSGKYGPPP